MCQTQHMHLHHDLRGPPVSFVLGASKRTQSLAQQRHLTDTGWVSGQGGERMNAGGEARQQAPLSLSSGTPPPRWPRSDLEEVASPA